MKVLTNDGGFPTPVLAEDERERREELNVLSVHISRPKGTDSLDLHLLYLGHDALLLVFTQLQIT